MEEYNDQSEHTYKEVMIAADEAMKNGQDTQYFGLNKTGLFRALGDLTIKGQGRLTHAAQFLGWGVSIGIEIERARQKEVEKFKEELDGEF